MDIATLAILYKLLGRAQNSGGVKLCRIDHIIVLVTENVGEFAIVNISYFIESGIWLGKILVKDVRSFASFPAQPELFTQ